jgi:hypothetical protein
VHTRQIGPSLLHFPLRCGRQNSPPQTRHFPPSTGRNGLRHAAHVNDRLTTRSSHSRAKVARYCGRRPMAKPGTSRPELIDTGRNKMFAKRDASGRFKAMDDVRRSLSADRRRTAKRHRNPAMGIRRPAGVQTIRIQRREDGISIDQIVLSRVTYLARSPGATKNDATILPRTQ